MNLLREGNEILFKDERYGFSFCCKPKSYDFGFEEGFWVKNCGWRILANKKKLLSFSLNLDRLYAGEGVDKLGEYRWVRQKWFDESKIEVEFKFYSDRAILAILRILNPSSEPLNIDFPLFSEDSIDENLYVAAIQSCDEKLVWPIVRIEKPKNALERLLETSVEGTEYLPFWLYNEKKTIVILPADNFVDTRFVCKKVRNRDIKEFSCELSGVPNGTVEHKVLIFYSNKGPSETLIEAGSFLRRFYNRQIPGVASKSHKYLGYSTANGAFYAYTLNEKVLLEVLNDLEAKKIPIKWLQIDGIWNKSSKRWPSPKEISKLSEKLREVSSKGFLDFVNSICGVARLEPNKDNFPNSFKKISTRISIGLWIWAAYFDRNTSYSQRYPWNDKDNVPIGKEFWLNMAEQFKKWRTIWVELDNLVQMTRFKSLSYIGEKEKWLVNVIESFGEYNIPVQMCMCPSKLYPVALKSKNAYFMRTGNDFREKPDPYEIYQNSYNSALAWAFGLYPCFDVYFTSKESYEKVKEHDSVNRLIEYYNSADILPELLAHALSCGVNYIGDDIGTADPDFIKKICYQNGELIHPDRPAIPIRSCYFQDPLKGINPLVTYTRIRKHVLVGVFNLSDSNQKYRIPLEEVELSPRQSYCDFKLFKEEAKEATEIISGDLNAKSCELHVVSSLRDGIAIIGDLEKLFPPYAIQGTYYYREGIEIMAEVEDQATIGVFCKKPKELKVDKKSCDYIIEEHLSKIKIDPGRHEISIKF